MDEEVKYMTITEDEYENFVDNVKTMEENLAQLRKMLAFYRTDEVFMCMERALVQIWEMDPDEPYETIRVMQELAMKTLNKVGYVRVEE